MSQTDTGPSTLTVHLAYAEASTMIIEALLQLLIERKVVPMDAVIETLETTIQAKRTLAEEGVHAEISAVAAGILSRIANSVAASARQ
jgi:hypothetical protein